MPMKDCRASLEKLRKDAAVFHNSILLAVSRKIPAYRWVADRLERFAGPLSYAPSVGRLRLSGAEPVALLARLFLLDDHVERGALEDAQRTGIISKYEMDH